MRDWRDERELLSLVKHPVADWWQSMLGTELLRARVPFNEALAEGDRLRILEVVQGLGFLDATVEVELVVPGGAKPGSKAAERKRVLRWVVNPGIRYEVDAITLQIADFDEVVGEVFLGPKVGVVFDGENEEALITALEQASLDAGRCLPEVVVERTVVSPGHVTLHYELIAGRPCVVGEVVAEGISELLAGPIDALLARRLPSGTPLLGPDIRRAVRRLRLSGAFQTVDWSTARSEGDVVDLTVTLREKPTLTRRPLIYIGGEGGFVAVMAGAEVERRHLFGGTGAVRMGGMAGYALLPFSGTLDEGDHGPVLVGGVDFELPFRSVQRVMLHAGVEGDLAVAAGVHRVNGKLVVGFRFKPMPMLDVDLGLEVRGVHHFALLGQQERFHSAFVSTEASGYVDPDSVQLVASHEMLRFRAALELDLRDNMSLPSRGLLLRVDATPVGLGAGSPWRGFDLDLRGYMPLVPDFFVLALRLQAGLNIYALEDANRPLYATRFHLGGMGNMRGWSFRRLAPPGYTGTRNDVAPGGDVKLFGSVEARVAVFRQLSLVAFLDVGRVWVGPLYGRGDIPQPTVNLGDLQPTLGGGFQIPTPVGRLRLEVAARLRQETGIEDTGPALRVHVGIGTGF